MSDYTELAQILRRSLSKDARRDILQAISDDITNGECPLCGGEEVPVDEEGNEIEGDNMEDTYEWREVHDDDCLVTLLEKPFGPK